MLEKCVGVAETWLAKMLLDSFLTRAAKSDVEAIRNHERLETMRKLLAEAANSGSNSAAAAAAAPSAGNPKSSLPAEYLMWR